MRLIARPRSVEMELYLDHRRCLEQSVEFILTRIPASRRFCEHHPAKICVLDGYRGCCEGPDARRDLDVRIAQNVCIPVSTSGSSRDDESSIDVEPPYLNSARLSRPAADGRELDGAAGGKSCKNVGSGRHDVNLQLQPHLKSSVSSQNFPASVDSSRRSTSRRHLTVRACG